MRAFSVSSEYIFDSTASLNLILATAISSAPTSAPASAPAAPLPPTNTPTNEDYNAGQAVVSFSVTVKPAFTKYLEETRNVSTKRVTQEKYNDIISWLTNPGRKALSQAERNAKSKAKSR
jgi:hypothetical protein